MCKKKPNRTENCNFVLPFHSFVVVVVVVCLFVCVCVVFVLCLCCDTFVGGKILKEIKEEHARCLDCNGLEWIGMD